MQREFSTGVPQHQFIVLQGREDGELACGLGGVEDHSSEYQGKR